MKKSYKKILIFEVIIFIFLILNSFKLSILSNYTMPSFILFLTIIFYFILGYEKDKSRYKKDLILSIIIDVIIYYILFYLFGILIGFAKNSNYLTLYGIVKHIIPLIFVILTKELLRYSILKKCGSNILLIICTTILMIVFDITTPLSLMNFKVKYDVLVFMGLSFLPSISTNILLSYITIKEGFKPSIVYSLIMKLPIYILPIIPNPNIYLKSIIDFLVPVIILINILMFYKKNEVIKDTSREYKKKKYGFIVLPIVLTIIFVYFVSGYFRYYAIAIASGSMHPVFDRGSVVVVDTKKIEYQKGDIIAFKANNIIVVHRIINIIDDDGKTYFYTKGDANKSEDDYQLIKEDIVGIVKYKIPYIGYPTVLLSEL